MRLNDLYWKIRGWILRAAGVIPPIKVDKRLKTLRLGNVHADWTFLPERLSEKSIIYCVGVGTDISFDISLIEKFSCKVFAIDPTPGVAIWLQSQILPTHFIYSQVGLADHDGELSFFGPENPTHISHTPRPIKSSSKSIILPVKKLETIMAENGHKKIDLLKLDIEGFEYSVIPQIIESKVVIEQLLVEFHHGFYNFTNQETIQIISQLRNAGFLVFNVSDNGREISFLNSKCFIG